MLNSYEVYGNGSVPIVCDITAYNISFVFITFLRLQYSGKGCFPCATCISSYWNIVFPIMNGVQHPYVFYAWKGSTLCRRYI